MGSNTTSRNRAAAAAASSTAAAAAAGLLVLAVCHYRNHRRRKRGREHHPTKTSAGGRQDGTLLPPPSCAYEALIGGTPLVELPVLSRLLARTIFVKMESSNPGGTGKDRAAFGMISAAEKSGKLPRPVATAAAAAGADAAPEDSVSAANASYCAELLLAVEEEDSNDREEGKQAPTSNGTSSSAPPAASAESTSEGRKSATSQTKRITEAAIDRAIKDAMVHSKTGGLVVEGTSGSTGISLANISKCHGHAAIVVMPDDQAAEKRTILRTLGATVLVVPTAAISNPNHYVNVARKIADRARDAFGIEAVFIDQFENSSNFDVHYTNTGPEILSQCPDISAFVMSSGTGGTVSGVSRYIKDELRKRGQWRPRIGGNWRSQPRCRSRTCRTVLVDPPGSALYNKIVHGVAFAPEQRERALRRHRYDTIAEGIGLDRVTCNLAMGIECIDDAVQVTDQEALDMAHWLLHAEGLWVGSSSAMNVVGAVRTALSLSENSKVVTVVCDGGQRHLTRFWNREFCLSWGLKWPGDLPEADRIPDCLKDRFKNS